ncbi:MAG: hypothetical protein J2P38_01530 [Candidatus Dormibacteraeota bacterium]|nr:hypothetical protein [Candidatus Dormibacteraeota bacterium]
MTEPSFDSAKAQALIDKLLDTTRVLTNQTMNRNTRAQAMQKHWTGAYADRFFGTEMPRMRQDAASLTSQMGNLIIQLSNAIDGYQQAHAQWWSKQPHPTSAPPGTAPSPPAPGR